MSAELEKLAVAALTDETMSANELGNLTASVSAAITAADEAAALERERVIDPALCPDPKVARAALEEAEISRGRLRTLQPRLEEKYQHVQAVEDAVKWRASYDKLKTARDDLSAELRDLFPSVTAALADLFARIANLDGRLSQLHQRRPGGAKGFLRSCELEARGLDDFTRDQPSLLRTTVLPEWVDSSKQLWPPLSTPASVLFSQSLPTDHPRHSKDWYLYQQQDVERIKNEAARGIKNEAAAQQESRRKYEESLPR
jgi:hypothetical protein